MRIWPFQKPTVEAKSQLTTPEAWLQELFGAVPAAAGISVSASAALAVPAVQSAVRVISESAASLRAKVVRIEGGKETAAADHPVQKLIDGDVNDWTDWFSFVRDIVCMANTHDQGGIAWINRTASGIAELIIYDAGVIQTDRKDTGETTFTLNSRELNPADVIHLRGPFTSCPLSLAREAIGTALVMERHQTKFFANGARPSGVLETPKAIGDEGVKKLLAGWKLAQQGADNAGKTPLLWDGTTYRPLTMNSTDAQFLELRKF
ncbi:MAG: phage portal protein, partial [Novosphingobium sp.]|nr:phage portal protein [Novosphingobium sp.]